MQIWNQKNIEIPEAVLRVIKNRSDFYQYVRFSVTKEEAEKPSRYSGRQCGTGVLLLEFTHENGNYLVHGHRLRPSF